MIPTVFDFTTGVSWFASLVWTKETSSGGVWLAMGSAKGLHNW